MTLNYFDMLVNRVVTAVRRHDVTPSIAEAMLADLNDRAVLLGVGDPFSFETLLAQARIKIKNETLAPPNIVPLSVPAGDCVSSVGERPVAASEVSR